MTSLLIGQAKSALVIGNELSKTLQVPEGDLKSRKVIPLSFFLLLGGAFVGGVVAVAALVLKQYAIIVSGVILCITNGIGAYEIKRLSLTKVIEDYIQLLAKKIALLYEWNKKANSLNNQLGKSEKELSIDVENYKKATAEGEKKIRDQALKIASLTEELKKIKEGLISLYDPLKNAVNTFINTGNSFLEANKMEKGQFSELVQDITQLNSLNTALNKEEDVFKENLASIKKLYEKAANILSIFPEIFKELQKKIEDEKKENQKLQTQINELKVFNLSISEHIQKMQAKEKEYKDLLAQLQALLPDNTKLDKEIELLEHQQKTHAS